MAKDAGSPLLTAHLWTLVGLSIVPGCLAGYGQQNVGGFSRLTANLLVGYLCAAYSPATRLFAYHQQSWFGGTFAGHDILVMITPAN